MSSNPDLPAAFNKVVKEMTALGLRQRPAQTRMLSCVYDTIKKQQILCIEAPTGTGKTLAYCLAALQAKTEQQVIIISTSTTALQEQFFQKDLILLEKILNKKLNVILCKGRRRYVCHARLFNPEMFIEDENDHAEIDTLQNLIKNQEWYGEIDKLSKKIAPELWQKISTDKSGCSAGRCEYFNECVFYQNRRKMYQADIVVTNHSLLLSDLELGGGVILPEMKDSIYILDECHHLPEKALSHFAKQAALMRSLDWLNNIGKTLNKAVLHIKIPAKHNDSLNQYIKRIIGEFNLAQEWLSTKATQFEENQLRITKLDENITHVAESIIVNADGISAILNLILRDLENVFEEKTHTDKAKADVIAHLQSSLEFILDRCNNLAATWRDLLVLNSITNQAPTACWFEKVISQEYQTDYTLHTSPINVSTAMQKLFWSKIKNGAILCSATIRALGKFNDFARKLGLKDNPSLKEEALESEFEHEHSILFSPRMQFEPSPALQEQHLRETVALLPQLILPKNGTLVLFTSRKAMEFVYQYIGISIKQDILLQNSLSKMELIKQHKEKVDQGKRSIIFGLASFAEGIDLPGQYCQHVIIHKIPFTLPSDPISQTRSEWLKKHQIDPFQLVTLPETSIKLTQYLGRLLRHEEDRGIVTILDKRLYSKNYGKSLLAGLPPFTQLINQTMEEFLQHPLVMDYYISR